MPDSEFYVGYQKQAPLGIARFVRNSVLAVFVIAAFLAGMLVSAQGRFALSFFEFGTEREFTGFVSEFPYPTLLVERPGITGAHVPYSRYLLTVPGKFGAQRAVSGLDGRKVRLGGKLVYRDDMTMIEVVPDSVSATREGIANELTEQVLGRYTLRGEIVDSKCFLGVMKPGNLKPHRACAVRCISGGIPPLLLVRDSDNKAIYFMLTGEDGRPINKEVLEFVAEPVEIQGTVRRQGSTLIIEAEPAEYKRLGTNAT